MPKPDLSELTKKLNIQGLVDNVKSIINPETNTPKPVSGDIIGEKMAAISICLQQAMKALNEQIKNLDTINRDINDLFKDLEAIRASMAKPESSAQEDKVAKETASDEGMPEASKENSPEEKK